MGKRRMKEECSWKIIFVKIWRKPPYSSVLLAAICPYIKTKEAGYECRTIKIAGSPGK